MALDVAERDRTRRQPRCAAGRHAERLPSVILTVEGAARVGHGQDVRPMDHQPSAISDRPSAVGHQLLVRLLSPGGDLLAIAEPRAGGALHPSVVLV
jgi:hypothetical protein